MISIDTQCGKFYFILGDSVEGYYLVKCLSSESDTFCGRYLKQDVGSLTESEVIFHETRVSDTFRVESILSEVLIVTETKLQNKIQFSIYKEELNDVLASISELNDK